LLRLITRDPTSGGELIVTRLEGLESGVMIEGDFSLGWMGQLTPDQLDFVGQLLRNRGNVQKLAAELGMSYNTARNRMDEIVAALGGRDEADESPSHRDLLARFAAGEIGYEETLDQIRRRDAL
jgi:hypothetical protein